MKLRVKICGLRRLEDVDACVAAGVDALGFNFYPRSPRYLPPQDAAALVERLPSSVVPVGVFVGAGPAEVATAVAQSGVRSIQLHGGEDPASYRVPGLERIQVVRVQNDGPLPEGVSPAADWVLLDAWVGEFGGRGARFDWGRVEEARLRFGKPMLVAGGITPDNVAELLARTPVEGIDVASGVEISPGVKDAGRVQALVAAVLSSQRSRSKET